MPTPSVTLITVVRNGISTVTSCLDSIARQTLPPQHVIIDGASTDGTLELLEKRPEVVSGRSTLLSEPDRGLYDAMNKGLRLAGGEVIGFLNADDFYPDSRVLEKVGRVFEDPTVESCYGDLVYVRETEGGSRTGDRTTWQGLVLHRYWKSGAFAPEKFRWGWMPPHPTFFVRRRIYERHGGFSLEFGSAADYELMLRFLLKHQVSSFYIPRVLVAMRVGGASNASLDGRLRSNRMDRKAWKANGLKPYPWTLWMKPIRKIPQWWMKPPVAGTGC